MHASIQINSSTSSDVLAELFKEGSVDPSLLMIHPCPPGKKDKSMRSDLMEFQVSRFGFDTEFRAEQSGESGDGKEIKGCSGPSCSRTTFNTKREKKCQLQIFPF